MARTSALDLTQYRSGMRDFLSTEFGCTTQSMSSPSHARNEVKQNETTEAQTGGCDSAKCGARQVKTGDESVAVGKRDYAQSIGVVPPAGDLLLRRTQWMKT